MVPYFQIEPISLFGLSIHTFEILTAFGIYLGIQTTLSIAKVRGLPEKNMIDVILLSIVTGFIGAHFVHVIFYEQDISHAEKFLQLSKGISSTGGFLIGGLAAWIYVRAKKLSVYQVGDCMIAGLLLAQFFGRLGCFTAHDHPGGLSSFPLAVRFPDGARHDLGFYEAILLLDFLIIAIVMRKKLNSISGAWMISGILYYGSMRFCLDFLRATDLPTSDPRYLGLTPAQYICLFFIGLGIYWWTQSSRRKALQN